MQESSSRLGYLMNQLEISGKELSDVLSIDITSISKWKNNQRRLAYKSKHTHDLARFLLNCEMEKKKHIIRDILLVSSPKINTYDEDIMVDALSVWLTGNLQDYSDSIQQVSMSSAHGYNTGVRIFTGMKGIQEGLETFWKSARSVPPGQEILIVDFGDIDYSSDASQIKENNVRLIRDAISYGHTIKIIDGAADNYKPYLSIFRWMSVYLSEEVELWYRQARDNRDNQYSIYLLPGACALYTMGVDVPVKDHHCILFTDTESLAFFEKSAQASFDKSQKMIEVLRVEDILGTLKVLDLHLVSKQLTYMLNPTPTFRSMSIDLLEKVLEDNKVDPDMRRICLEANTKTREIRERCDYRQIYSLDAMEENAKAPFSVDYDLSSICGKEMIISKENLKRHMEYLQNIPHTDQYTITLANLNSIAVLPTNISMIVQDDRLVVAWDARQYDCRMYSEAITVIGGFYNYMEEVWNSISNICKTEEWTNRQFSKIIRLLA
jgi:hypothetical protein